MRHASPYEIWSHLVVTQGGTSQVKRAKIDLLCSLYENFTMHEHDSIDDMLTKFTKITNGLAFLCDEIDNDQRWRRSFGLFHLYGKSNLRL